MTKKPDSWTDPLNQYYKEALTNFFLQHQQQANSYIAQFVVKKKD